MKKLNRKISPLTFSTFISIILFLITSTSLKSAEPTNIIELPSAGCLSKYDYQLLFYVFENGGIRTSFELTPFANTLIGISFGGTQIVGSGSPEFQSLPGVNLKFRFIDETRSFPAIAIGFSNQGYGKYISATNRFETFSPGFYLVFSKSFSNPAGFFDIHFGTNYSLEPPKSDRTINFFLGFRQDVKNIMSIVLEFNTNLNDNNKAITNKKGLLNIGFAFHLSKNVQAGVVFKDLLNHLQEDGKRRNLFLTYTSRF